MILAKVQNPELYREARNILLAMGHLNQVENDYMDCYGDPHITGKIGQGLLYLLWRFNLKIYNWLWPVAAPSISNRVILE